MTRTVNANSVKIVAEDSEEGILLSVSQDGKLATNKIDNQGNVDNQASALTSNFISLTDTPEAFQAEKYLKVNAQGNALEFSDISISTNFISLTDTPNAFKAGSYLRVNTAGDSIEQIKTAPPDGGAGDNSVIQAASNFAGKLPDTIIAATENDTPVTMHLYHVSSTTIQYQGWSRATNPYFASFNNDTTGSGASQNYAWGFFDGATSLQDIIDSGHAIFHGQKSGTSGAGSLSVIKSQAERFYTELPDAIVVTHSGGYECILRLKFAKSITGQPNGNNFYYEARVQGGGSSTGGTNDYLIVFKDDADGTFNGYASETDNFPTDGSMDQNLRWFIENGRALYHGSDPVTSRIGQLEEIKSVVPLANEIDIPDAILGRDSSGNLRLIKFTQARPDRFDYQSNSSGGNYLFAFDSTTGAWTGGSHAVNVTKEYDDIQGYIAAGRALFYGRTGSNLDQLVGDIDDLSDVDTSTTAPSAGQVLVYDDADSKWKPGAQSTDFTDLTDTPSSLDAGSYLRVNTAGDAIEQIKTAPPDGGAGDNSLIQAHSKFAGKLPDAIVVRNSGYSMHMVLRSVYDGDANGAIEYMDPFSEANANSGYISFYNNATGTGIRNITSGYAIPNGRTSLQDVINDGNAIFHGQKSGTSGAGSLSVIKAATNNFYTELPDQIVVPHGTDGQYLLSLMRIESGYIEYVNEDYGDASTDLRAIRYNRDADGTQQQKWFFTHADSANSLRWYIENGRAIYHGHTDNTGSAGAHPEIQAASNFEGVIPDGVIMKRSSLGAVYNYQFNYISSDKIYFVHWTDASASSSYYARCNNDATGSGFTAVGTNASQYVTPAGETTLQQLIDNGNVVYHGGRSIDSGAGASSVEQLTDVDVTTTPPSAGQVLVYDDADSKWKPGAQSTDFTDLTDTPSSLDAGSYLRVNTTGDAIEQIKTAPPDGGIGDNSGIQAASNFAGKLPDQLMDLAVANAVRVFDLYHINTGGIYYVYKNNNGYCKFNNSVGNGGVGVAIHTLGTAPQYTNIQDYIDNGQAVFHGQKSGTSGVGSLSYLKSLANSSPNGGFYTELPDAIVSENTSGTYNGIFKLHWVKPNATAGGTNWEVIYRTEAFSNGDYFMGYLLDADGTKVLHSGVTHVNPTTKNLRWFIENGRAIYNGGYNESNVVSARIAANGTILSSNYDWIQSVTATGGSYAIVFKPGHFTSPPTINVSADIVDGVSHVMAEYNHLTKDTMNVVTMRNNDSASVAAEFCIMAQHQDRPIGLAAPQYGIKAWGVFDGAQGTSNNHTITGFTGGNVASIVRISTGIYKVSFINPMPHADYSVSGSANPWGFGGSYIGVRHTYNSDTSNNSTTTTFVMDVRDTSNVNSNSNRISFQVVC